MKPISPEMIFKAPFFPFFFGHLSPSLINILTEKFPWNRTEKTPTFNSISPHVTTLTTLEAIRTYQDGMADQVSGNIVAELRKK